LFAFGTYRSGREPEALLPSSGVPVFLTCTWIWPLWFGVILDAASMYGSRWKPRPKRWRP